MVDCDICGKKGVSFIIEVEGAKMAVCPRCAYHGKIIHSLGTGEKEEEAPAKMDYSTPKQFRMEEEIGTAGAGFRFIYGAFLNEAADIINQPWLKEISLEMGENANRWRDFSYLGSRNCKKRAKPEESYDFLADILLDCAKKEEIIFKKLSKIR